jgi:hypothetical protein
MVVVLNVWNQQAQATATLLASGNHDFVQGVREYVVRSGCDMVGINVATFFYAANPTTDEIISELQQVRTAVGSCQRCMSAGSTCKQTAWDLPCEACEAGRHQCVALVSLHSFSDQQPRQRAALGQLLSDQQEAADEKDAASDDLHSLGFGLRHFAKSVISAVRNYNITDNTDGFSFGMLYAMYVSVSPAGQFSSHHRRLCWLLLRPVRCCATMAGVRCCVSA